MIVDSHVHLHFIDCKKIKTNLDEIIKEAQNKQVEAQLCVATNIDQFNTIIDICKNYDKIYGSIGVHPCEVLKKQVSAGELTKLSKNENIIAIGETGLDYFRGEENKKSQIERFEKHIEASKESGLPLIIHSRNAKKDTLEMLAAYKSDGIKGVVHCFTEDFDMAKKIIDLGFLISFSGIITFKNAKHLSYVVQNIPTSSFLVETDAPYLSPEPHRGKINRPAYIVRTVEKISSLINKSFDEVAHNTKKNFENLFF